MIVPTTIDFDHELGAMVDEVSHIATDRRLSSDVKIESAKSFPKCSFARGHLMAQAAGAPDGARSVTWS
jgi:hypothetical protein